MTQENTKPNHLIQEKSPYLLQHAYNPVDWYPWGQEAFDRAKAEDKPIFLSIGYSTCHWCHVMAHESFEDEEVAALLNKDFISIKLDKEERPDIDHIYMTVCQALTGHGGWPLTIIMTPDQKPFFAATYLPKRSRNQMLGMMELVPSVAKMWKEDRERILHSSEDITNMLRNAMDQREEHIQPEQRLFGTGYLQFKKQFDSEYGGFGEAPKFPSPHNLLFLLRYAVEYEEKDALSMVEKTLESMFRGGIYDHIGGGFSRYSTDKTWLVPHFEKMLYDNALLALTYAEAYQLTNNKMYEKVVRETLQYIMAEMTDENGGFYCAQDADSEGEEGKFYVFTPQEVLSVLGEKEGTWFNEHYGITEHGNFEGKSIPNLIDTDSILTQEVLSKQLRAKLYEYRKNRMSLHKDDKILTSWNALMIVAFLKAHQVFADEEYLRVAQKAYEFIGQQLRDESGRLYIRYREGHRQGLANLEDYAYLIWAEVTFYEATFEPAYLIQAVQDTEQMIDLFWDEEHGGFFYYGSDADALLLRPKEVYDGAMPSGNSVAAYVLAKLTKLTRKESLEKVMARQFAFVAGEIKDYPSAYAFSLCALMLTLLKNQEMVCVLKDSVDFDELHQLVRKFYLPNTSVVAIAEHLRDGLAIAAPYTKEYKMAVTESEIYICEGVSCHPPIYGMDALLKQLQDEEPHMK